MPSNDETQTGNVQQNLTSIVPDKRLRELMDSDPDAVCSLIVEAQLPPRQFSFADKGSKRLVSSESGESPAGRDEELSKLADELKPLSENGEAIVMSSAGAVVINAAAKQLAKISVLPGVKAVRENRKLPPVRIVNPNG